MFLAFPSDGVHALAAVRIQKTGGVMRDSKECASCGRRFEWRKKWEKVWEEVRYCSASCRRRRVSPADKRLETAILTVLEQRAAHHSVCPSEIARSEYGRRWRDHMETVRRAARRLVGAGLIEITQRGRTVDPTDVKGPIRLRLRSTPVGIEDKNTDAGWQH